MGEIKNNPLQFGLGGEFSKVKSNKPVAVLRPVFIGSEQINLIDERIKKEIPELRMVKKDEAILVTSQKGGFTRVFLIQDVILGRQRNKKYPKRFNYFLRAPVVVRSVEHGNIWTAKHGAVDTFGKVRKIPKRLMSEVILKLRNYTKLT